MPAIIDDVPCSACGKTHQVCLAFDDQVNPHFDYEFNCPMTRELVAYVHCEQSNAVAERGSNLTPQLRRMGRRRW